MNSLLTLLLLAAPAHAGLRVLAPRVAVVIDDFGKTTAKNPPDELWMSFDEPMTFAVIPELDSTTVTAAATLNAGKELIIHFPFDPYQKFDLAKDGVTAGDMRRMTWLLKAAREEIPGAVGLNNHRSLRATMNRPLMRAFMKLLKPTGLFFVDSTVSSMTVAGKVARAAGIPTTVNFRFLDTEPEHTEDFCVRMFAEAVDWARRRGYVLVIGHHYYRTTLACLKAEMPRYEREGIRFVRASSVVH